VIDIGEFGRAVTAREAAGQIPDADELGQSRRRPVLRFGVGVGVGLGDELHFRPAADQLREQRGGHDGPADDHPGRRAPGLRRLGG
jgi:hypothetical protein